MTFRSGPDLSTRPEAGLEPRPDLMSWPRGEPLVEKLCAGEKADALLPARSPDVGIKQQVFTGFLPFPSWAHSQ
jgi:hypothetical protein